MREQINMTAELFNKLIKEDKWINYIANPVKCNDSNSKFSHYQTLSYPIEYIVTEKQINKAKKLYAIRKAETLASITKGELAFYPMGGDFHSILENGVGNYRILCYFKNSSGHKYFIDLSSAPGKEYRFFIEFSIDEDLRKKRKDEFEHICRASGNWSMNENQDYYNCFNMTKQYQHMPFTFDNVIEFINKTYGCTYTSARLIMFFANWEEWCCECR